MIATAALFSREPITLGSGAALEGGALAQKGAVTLNANAIARPTP
jgi:hypothetical protein